MTLFLTIFGTLIIVDFILIIVVNLFVYSHSAFEISMSMFADSIFTNINIEIDTNFDVNFIV